MKHKGLAQQLSVRKNTWRSKKGRKRLIKRYLKILMRLFILISLVVIVWGIIRLQYFLINAPYFQVKEPIIILEDKESIIKKSEIVNLFKEFCLTNYSSLQPNIFKLNLTGLKNTLLENPKIENVMVHRKFPHNIVIKVKSRIAMAKIVIKSSVFGVDKNLVAFKMKTDHDLPVISGLGSLKIGEPLQNKRLKEALSIISIIKEYKFELLHHNISKIDISNQYDILMMTKIGQTKIHMGCQLEPKRLVERLKELETILKYFQQDNQNLPEYIDLRFDNIIVKEKENQGE